MRPLISVCIPVYGTEALLRECLESVAVQEFKDAEIVVVNDASLASDGEGKSCKQIIKEFKKHCPYKITYLEHEKNKGLLEARRTAVYAAKGKYIACLDSDDRLLPGALKTLYETALENNADLVHASSISNTVKNRNDKVYIGSLCDKDILFQWLVKASYNDALWGKLIDRELYLEALDKIPAMYCNMAEDIAQWFFIALKAKKYIGIEDKVYFYNASSGMTSKHVISDSKGLQGIVSPASVFTVIHQWLQQEADKTGALPVSAQELAAIKSLTHQYLNNNLLMVKECVVPELQEEAHELLCEYWGRDFVEKVSRALPPTS